MSVEADLQQLSVLLTRPHAQSEGLASIVTALGGKACELPLMEIAPVTEPAAREQIKARILNLDQYSAAIFISTNAARLGLEWIDAWWPQLPTGLSAYAVGPGTAAMLRTFDWPVFCPEHGVTSEDLLALPGLTEVSGQRIALFRGVGGRELIAETLRERGASVDYLELYHRRTPEYGRDRVAELIRREGVNVIVVTSAQILDVLLHCLQRDDPEDESDNKSRSGTGEVSVLDRVWVIVPSERVRQVGLNAGLPRVINAGGADDDTVLSALAELAATLR